VGVALTVTANIQAVMVAVGLVTVVMVAVIFLQAAAVDLAAAGHRAIGNG
jgi:hypothetical protein